MVYNCRDGYEYAKGGTPLTRTGAGPGYDERHGRRSRGLLSVFTLVLAFAAALVLAGCGGPGSGGSQSSGEPEHAGSSEAEDAGGETAQLGTPSLGREDAPVVLTEYSDYQ